MNAEIMIRETHTDDLSVLEALYHAAFNEEDLFPLVQELLADTQNTSHLTAVLDGDVVGHIVFTKCHARGCAVSTAGADGCAARPSTKWNW